MEHVALDLEASREVKKTECQLTVTRIKQQ